jgi:hypothetical protein
MSKWGSEGFASGSNLEASIRLLNPKAKQAMYGAARAKTIHKGSWNGCAFNAAGMQVGGSINEHITSIDRAAEVFGVSQNVVQKFISAWDKLPGSDEESTQELIHTLEKVGLFSEASETRLARKIRVTLYKSLESELRDQLEEAFENESIEGVCEARELLFA